MDSTAAPVAGDRLAERNDARGTGAGLPAPGVLDELSNAIASARTSVSNFLELVSLEARRAGWSLMWMAVWGVVAAVCIIAAWLGLMLATAMWMVFLGLPPMGAVLAVSVMNLAAGIVLIYVCRGLSRDLLFSATRRQVAGIAPPRTTEP